MVTKKTWDEFRESGCLWFVNMILHAFGWSIVVELDNSGKVCNAYPARVKFRGFDESTNTRGYRNLSNYMKVNANALSSEANEK